MRAYTPPAARPGPCPYPENVRGLYGRIAANSIDLEGYSRPPVNVAVFADQSAMRFALTDPPATGRPPKTCWSLTACWPTST